VIGKRHLNYHQNRPSSSVGDTELERLRIMLRLLGVPFGYNVVSGFYPDDELGRTHRLVFQMDGRALCAVTYKEGDDLQEAADKFRRQVAWSVLLHDREDRSYIMAAMNMYHPDTSFARACLGYLWRYGPWHIKCPK
jgi:hypothetical protein